jgi:hypothetical protein
MIFWTICILVGLYIINRHSENKRKLSQLEEERRRREFDDFLKYDGEYFILGEEEGP